MFQGVLTILLNRSYIYNETLTFELKLETMKTKTVMFVEVCNLCVRDLSAATFLSLCTFGYAGMMPDIVGYAIMFLALIPMLTLWAVVSIMSENFETLPAKGIIIDDQAGIVIDKPLSKSITFLPLFDVRLKRWKRNKFSKIQCDGHGELEKNPIWINTQLVQFNEHAKSRTYASYLSWKQALGKFLKTRFRKDFSKELKLSYEEL
jgi:hypothetical protein